jgi:flagellin-like protein
MGVGQRWTGSNMRVYYQDSEVCITPAAFRGDGQAYPLRDIERAWRVRRRALGGKVKSASSVIGLVVVIQVVLVLVGRWVLALTSGGMVLVAGVVLFVRWMIHLAAGAPALNAVEDLRRYGSRLELWAVVNGADVLLLRTDDAIRHGQVCRALARALADDRRRRSNGSRDM